MSATTYAKRIVDRKLASGEIVSSEWLHAELEKMPGINSSQAEQIVAQVFQDFDPMALARDMAKTDPAAAIAFLSKHAAALRAGKESQAL